MLRIAILAALAALLVGGCGHAAPETHADSAAPKKEAEAPVDPVEATRAQMHEGAFQLTDAADDLARAISIAKALQASTKSVDLKAALADILDKLDDAGGSIADFTAMPPELAEFKKDFDNLDKRRLDAIDAANDALHQVNESNDNLDDFTDKPAPEDADALGDLGDALDEAAGDLSDAIKGFGGKVESDDTQEIKPTPDQGDAVTDKKKPAVRPDL